MIRTEQEGYTNTWNVYQIKHLTLGFTFSVSVSQTFMVLSKELETNMPVS